ncbi:hypothetical protein PTKIN_Ptkin14bG0142900 [Pterospermum kingtungense]
MPNWKEWDPCEGDEQVSKFPNLGELYIENCPQLVGSLPTRLHSLQKLTIKECKQLAVSISSFSSLCELKINGCEELVDRCSTSAQVTSLHEVSLSDISKFSISAERIMSRFTNVEYFEIVGWKELASLSRYGLGLIGHRFITIQNCPQLVSLETEEVEEGQEKISGIEWLKINFCTRLNRLPKLLHALPFLTEMTITHCPSLVCFAENNLPPTLKRLKIWECKDLKYLVDERESKSIFSNSCSLEELEIKWCESLICLSSTSDALNGLQILRVQDCSKLISLFLNAELPTALKQLEILSCPELEFLAQDFHRTSALQSIQLDCGKIKCLPRGLDKLSHLQEIKMRFWPNLVSFEESGLPDATNLRVFSIIHCKNFAALPKCMYNFTSLRELTLFTCSVDISFPEGGLPTNLTSLSISNAPKIYSSLVEWGFDRLTSLKKLFISGEGCSDVVFPKEETGMMLPASLTHIFIGDLENLEYMSSNAFRSLTSLKFFKIFDCSKLGALPEKEVLLSLERLWIDRCPLLKENCKRDKGPEWSKIAHIPSLEIDC